MSTRIFTVELPAKPANHHPESSASPSAQEIVLQAAFGYVVSACLGVFVKLGIADLLGNESKDVKQLAQKAGADEDYLFRVLRALEPAGIVRRTSPRIFGLTAAGSLLRKNAPQSLSAGAEWITDPLHFKLYSELRGSIESGTTTFDRVYREPFFHWVSRQENAFEARVFNNAMTSFSDMCISALLEAYNFGSIDKLIDVGGGHGAILRSILRAYPRMHGVVAEMEAVVPQTRIAIAQDGLASRCQAVECDFFTKVPAEGDAYFMKHIIHDWADEPASRLLRNIRSVMPKHGRLLLAECVLDDSAAVHPGKLLDIEMIAFVGGKERTADEFRQLLLQSGFTLKRVIPTRSPFSLIEALPL